MCLVNGKGRFLTPRSSEIWGAIDPKLKTKKHVLGATLDIMLRWLKLLLLLHHLFNCNRSFVLYYFVHRLSLHILNILASLILSSADRLLG